MLGKNAFDCAEIPTYRDFISRELIQYLEPQFVPVVGVPNLRQLGSVGGLESAESLRFLCDLYAAVKPQLRIVLQQRVADRLFIDDRTHACFELNAALKINFQESNYRTIIGEQDADGRIVIGPRSNSYCRASDGALIAPLPVFLQGSHVTLFGPPDDAKLSINAMNAFHRALDGEPAIVSELLKDFTGSAKWGADDEDSKTPLRADLIAAGENLAGCFDHTLSYIDGRTGKSYQLASSHLSLPIKRFPGLALPCSFLFLGNDPLPLHLYDFALHLYANWNNPQALVFYVPKLENEEEAAYIHHMIDQAERLIAVKHPQYQLGTVRLMIVLENPRALFRVNEMMDALHPYFAGASLGWHDFLASTARVMKHDANYRIPVKADPNIVVNHIKASHDLLASVVGARRGIKVGGMYGVLPADNDCNSASFQVTIKGFIRDVIAQLKRNLDGFWVAHPDFVRIGLALVEAWKRAKQGDFAVLDELVRALLSPQYHAEVLEFIHGPDVRGLDVDDPMYPRALLVADGRSSGSIANHDAEEVRYNIFQSLQYLTDWLCGNGCVALPAHIDGVRVRVMDDLATAERSRWEVWHEVYHQRVTPLDFVRIAHEELHFIRKDLSDERRTVQVKWDDRTRKWYPVALNLMLQLMASDTPVEFATELLLPFTLDTIRENDNPWEAMRAIEPSKYEIPARVARLHAYFGMCGCSRFAAEMAQLPVVDMAVAEQIIRSFTLDEINEAAHFHGDIGEGAATLDAHATREQAGVLSEALETTDSLRALGQRYRLKFGMKFLIAASGRTGAELLAALQTRLRGSQENEITNAREALWQITRQRLETHAIDTVKSDIERARVAHGVMGASVCVIERGELMQQLDFGYRDALHAVSAKTLFEIASLSKPIASCYAMEFFRNAGIPLSTSVNALFAKTSSPYRIQSLDPTYPAWGDQVSIAHLLSHQALNMHYVWGIPANSAMPPMEALLNGNAHFGYDAVGVIHEPGTKFSYSGGGFMVLQHLLESMLNAPIEALMSGFLSALGMHDCSFATTTDHSSDAEKEYASGFDESHGAISAIRKRYPACAAGALSTAMSVGRFLIALARAQQELKGCGPISHDTAVRMLHASDGRSDKGSHEFMGCAMGLGVFIAEAGPNRLAIHQGANDGFRALFMHCYAGPDAGKGCVILSTGDHAGMLFVAESARILLRHFGMRGVDLSRSAAMNAPSFEGIAQEQRVNAGYRELVLSAFEPDLPEAIIVRGPLDPLSRFNLAIDAKVVSVSNQRFARAENLISPNTPTFDPALFGRQGKIMDSWESVRHNEAEFDWMILELPIASIIDCVSISTQFHRGNHAEAFELDGWDEQVQQWRTIVPRMHLNGHSMHGAESVAGARAFRKVRVRMYPDGGLTRLGLFSKSLPPHERAMLLAPSPRAWPAFDAQTKKPLTPMFAATAAEIAQNRKRLQGSRMDIANAAVGGRIVSASDEHYSPAANVIAPSAPRGMADGLESARSREAGHSEHVVIALAQPACIARIELDFSHFVNNNPREVAIDGRVNGAWKPLVARTNVKAFAGNSIAWDLTATNEGDGLCDQIRVMAFPDGGINRVRVFAAK